MSLDDGTPLNYSSYRPFYRPEQLLFQASNLGAQEHNIAVRSETGTNSTVYFAVDYVQVFTPSSWDNSRYVFFLGLATVLKGFPKRIICCPNCWHCRGLCFRAHTSRGPGFPFTLETREIFIAQKEERGSGRGTGPLPRH